MFQKHNTLVFLEDPGAANFLVPVIPEIKKKDLSVTVFGAGTALKYLDSRNISFEISDSPEEILKQIKPALVIVGTSENLNSMGLELIAKAKGLGITTVGIIDSPIAAAYRFSGQSRDPKKFSPKFVLIPDLWTKDIYLKLGFEEKSLKVFKHPFYDALSKQVQIFEGQNREEMRKKLFPRRRADQPIVVFAGELSESLDPSMNFKDEYTLKGRSLSRDRSHIVFEEFLDSIKDLEQKPFVVLRLHPKENLEYYSNYKGEFDQISHGGEALELVYFADLVVGMTTTLLAEAAWMGTQTLSILPRLAEQEWLSSIREGVTPVFSQRSSIQKWVSDFFKSRPLLRTQSKSIEKNHLPSAGQIADFLKSLI